ncbi:hypothetical protein [Streptomyces sp. NPDC018031]|uniref:hypothetical protein n=1 Tax=Streptomyces sp. NPDC018031 TaxID=3365033 RepID=UPI00379B5B6C
MASATLQRRITELLGHHRPAVGDWCTIGRIPEPPADVRTAVGGGRLRPGIIRPLEALQYVWVLLALVVGLVAGLIEVLLTLAAKVFQSKAKREAEEKARLKLVREQEERDAAIAEHRLDRVFDGDWNGTAGRLLLQWYGRSSHPERLVIMSAGTLVLAAPPRRTGAGRDRKAQVITTFTGDEAVVQDPLRGRWKTGLFRIRFADGSWLVLTAEEPSGIRECVMVIRQRDGENPSGFPVDAGSGAP